MARPTRLLICVMACLLGGAWPGAGAAAADSRPGAVRLTGTLQSLHGAARGGGELETWMLVTRVGRRLPLEVPEAARPRAGARVLMVGRRQGGVIVVRSLRRLPGAVARSSSTPTGAKKTAVVLFNFREDRSQPFSPAQVRDAFFTGTRSASAYFSAQTGGRLSLTGRDRTDGDVYGWYEIDQTATVCFGGSNGEWYTAADAAVRTAGHSLAGYDHVVYVHPRTDACPFVGIAGLDSDFSSLNGDIRLWVTGHELGHNYGFEHAGKAYCQENGRWVPVSDTCSVGAYDDPYDIMGNRFQRHVAGMRAAQAGWVPSSEVTTVTADGVYDIAPLGASGGAPRVLHVPRPDGRAYWLELRRPAGPFDDFSLTDPVVSGVLIRVAGSPSDPGASELIDVNPENDPDVMDEALSVGGTFTDPDAGLSFTTQAAGETGARVAVSFAAPRVDASGAEAEPVADTEPTGADGGASPSPVRLHPTRARAGGRTRPHTRLHGADGRALELLASRHRATLEARFAPGEQRGRAARLALRVRGSRSCRLDVALRSDGGRWRRIGAVRVATRWSSPSLAIPTGALGRVTDVRVGCRESRRGLRVDSAAIHLS